MPQHARRDETAEQAAADDATQTLGRWGVDPGEFADFRQPEPAPGPTGAMSPYWDGHRAEQAGRALGLVLAAGDAPGADVFRRAAVMLRAAPWSPAAERELGIAGAPAELFGQPVKCATCRRRYTCQPEDDYYDAPRGTGGAALRTGGRCFGCVLTTTRPDAAQPVLAGTVVAHAGTATGQAGAPRPKAATRSTRKPPGVPE